MTNEEYDFILFDRIEKIKQIDKELNLQNNSFVAFSGGKDSTVLHYLIDLALPNNNIPRVFQNTAIEYSDIRKFVKELSKNDNRIIILNSNVNIKEMLNKYGYPFKSKEHSLKLYYFKKGTNSKKIIDYFNRVGYIKCPKNLLYQTNKNFDLKISDKCCLKLKKEPQKRWAKENKKSIVITGIKREEKGQREKANCLSNHNTHFNPLVPISEEFENEFIKRNNIRLCKLYYPPYNFKRTGCKGCPFNLNLQQDLEIMEQLLPNERKQCDLIWHKVYDEYKRIGFRLKERQTTIFDFIEENK